nr:sigma-70 family RNA polymerase sigma factor [Kerstersia gyiorum]
MAFMRAPYTDIEQIYHAHQPWLKSWLARKLGDVHGAADVVQDVFMRLLTRIEPAPLLEPRAMLTTIAQRVLASRWRREQLERAYLDSLAQHEQAYAMSAEAQAIVIETLMEVDQLLAGLPRAVREVFLLSQLEGLRQAEIAEKMGISVTTVKRYLARAALQCYFPEGVQAICGQGG